MKKVSAILFSLVVLNLTQAQAAVVSSCSFKGIDAQVQISAGTTFENIDGALVKAVRSSLVVDGKEIKAMKETCKTGTKLSCSHQAEDGTRYMIYPQVNATSGNIKKIGLVVWSGDQALAYDSATCHIAN